MLVQGMAPISGITSTYVENTKSFNVLKFELQDHLHIRGEYSEKDRKDFIESGSPPHTWRIHHCHLKRGQLVRITSTCVENTLAR